MGKRGEFVPTTTTDPIMRQLFTAQERDGMGMAALAAASGLSWRVLSDLRHPRNDGRGKRPTLAQARAIAHALGYDFPNRLERATPTQLIAARRAK